MKAQKGLFLSGLILFFGFAITLATVFLIFDRDLRSALGAFPGWFSPFLVVFLLARLTALYAIWDLRRWGVYAFVLLESLEVGMGLFVFKTAVDIPMRAVFVALAFLVLLAVWFLALRPNWRLFK